VKDSSLQGSIKMHLHKVLRNVILFNSGWQLAAGGWQSSKLIAAGYWQLATRGWQPSKFRLKS